MDIDRGKMASPLAKLLEASDDQTCEGFLKELATSPTIEITHTSLYTSGVIMRAPRKLICTFSARFRDLCTANPKHKFTLEELFDGNIESYHRINEELQTEELFSSFLEWLHSGTVHLFDVNISDAWYFGQQLGAPGFQNAVIHFLCAGAPLKKLPEYTIGDYLDNYFIRGVDIVVCWQRVNFALDEAHGWDIEYDNRVHWNNKQLMKFILDFLVWLGHDDVDARSVMFEGGYLAHQLSRLFVAEANSPGNGLPPWAPENFNGYLANEDISGLTEMDYTWGPNPFP